MISIRKATELDQAVHLARTLANIYDHAIWSVAQYAVEIDPQAVTALRVHLSALRDQLGHADSAEDWQVIQASFRGELREYRDKSNEQVTRLRSEFASAAVAMQAFADSVATTGIGHEEELKGALEELSQIHQADSIEVARSIVRSTTATIKDSVERMQKSHKLSIAQLRDEIRLLHNQVEIERRAAFLDQTTGVWNRHKMDELVSQFTDKDEPFSLVILCVRNLRRLDTRFSRGTVDSALKAVVQRLTSTLEEGTIVGRWDEESFATLLPVEPAEAIRISREAAIRLSGTYSVQEDGVSHSLSLLVVSGVIDHSPGTSYAAFSERLVQMSNTLNAP